MRVCTSPRRKCESTKDANGEQGRQCECTTPQTSLLGNVRKHIRYLTFLASPTHARFTPHALHVLTHARTPTRAYTVIGNKSQV